METCYSSIEREVLCSTVSLPKLSSLLFCQRGKNHYRPQNPGEHIQERYGNAITEITMHSIAETPIKDKHNLQPG